MEKPGAMAMRRDAASLAGVGKGMAADVGK